MTSKYLPLGVSCWWLVYAIGVSAGFGRDPFSYRTSGSVRCSTEIRRCQEGVRPNLRKYVPKTDPYTRTDTKRCL